MTIETVSLGIEWDNTEKKLVEWNQSTDTWTLEILPTDTWSRIKGGIFHEDIADGVEWDQGLDTWTFIHPCLVYLLYGWTSGYAFISGSLIATDTLSGTIHGLSELSNPTLNYDILLVPDVIEGLSELSGAFDLYEYLEANQIDGSSVLSNPDMSTHIVYLLGHMGKRYYITYITVEWNQITDTWALQNKRVPEWQL